jgi:predicted lipoprotein with Yx(FWY)xxD motif
MRNRRITIAIAGLSVAAIAGGIAIAATAGGSTALPSTAATSTTLAPSPTRATASPGASVPSNPATVRTAMATVGGSAEIILVDNKGFPLYIYKPDTATQSMVTGSLAALWPPLVARAPTASGASGALKVVSTSNGQQVAYNGHFLYTFVEDSPGHVTGQGVQNFYVATPGITAISPAASGNAKVSPAPVSGGYGY